MVSKQRKDKTKKSNGLQLVLFRNAFYRDQYKTASIALIVLLLMNALLAFGVIYKATRPSQSKFFALAADGRMINTTALSDPTVTNAYVVQWTADKVRAAFSQDFMHYRGQLQSVSGAFTDHGWNDFYKALQSSNNLNTLVKKEMVSDAVITKAPVIEQTSVVSGHYAWKLKMSIMLTLVNSSNDKISMPFEVTVIVLRESVENYPDKIAINNFLPVLIQTEGSRLLG